MDLRKENDKKFYQKIRQQIKDQVMLKKKRNMKYTGILMSLHTILSDSES